MRDPIPVYVHLRRAKDLIDRDFAEPLDVPALARAAHASRAHFVRSFKKAFAAVPPIPACFTLMHTRPYASTFREADSGDAG